MSQILIQNLFDNTLLLLEIVLDILDVRFESLERKENTKQFFSYLRKPTSMWLEGVQNHCLFIFLSTIESIISLLEIDSDESDIDPKLI